MKKTENNATVTVVSKKFYAEISERVAEACAISGSEQHVKDVMAIIDRYITEDIEPDESAGLEACLIFMLLRPEIDKAVVRSASARHREAVRRVKTDAEKPMACHDRPPVVTPEFNWKEMSGDRKKRERRWAQWLAGQSRFVPLKRLWSSRIGPR